MCILYAYIHHSTLSRWNLREWALFPFHHHLEITPSKKYFTCKERDALSKNESYSDIFSHLRSTVYNKKVYHSDLNMAVWVCNFGWWDTKRWQKKRCAMREKNTAGFQTFSDSESHTGNIFSILHGDFFKLKNAKKLYMYFLFLYKKHNKTSSHQQHNSSSDINNINFSDYY